MNLPPAVVLDELELDALTELVNIGVSRAAASLRDMVGREILLSVPSVAIVTRSEAARSSATETRTSWSLSIRRLTALSAAAPC